MNSDGRIQSTSDAYGRQPWQAPKCAVPSWPHNEPVAASLPLSSVPDPAPLLENIYQYINKFMHRDGWSLQYFQISVMLKVLLGQQFNISCFTCENQASKSFSSSFSFILHISESTQDMTLPTCLAKGSWTGCMFSIKVSQLLSLYQEPDPVHHRGLRSAALASTEVRSSFPATQRDNGGTRSEVRIAPLVRP